MSFVTYPGSNVGLLLKTVQAVSLAASPPPPPPPPPGSITPSLFVGYVDSSGNRQWTEVVDNVTTISGTAPFFVEFYGGESVSAQADSNTPGEAFCNMGFLMNYGEGLGGNWSISGRPRDTDRGGPIYAHAYTTAGTHQARLTMRDSAGNQAFVRVNIVVTAPGSGVTMTPGVLPTFTNNTVYYAPAGGVWPDIDGPMNGRWGVRVIKQGAGPDPVFGRVNLDNRRDVATAVTRTAGISFWNCDVAEVTTGGVGFDYCAFVGGRVRGYTSQINEFWADEAIANGWNETRTNNLRYARGLLLQDTGVMTDINTHRYVIFGSMRGLHLKNVILRKTTDTQHNVRGVFSWSSFRHCLLDNEQASVSYFKLQGLGATLNYVAGVNRGVPDPWDDQDRTVVWAESRRRGVPGSIVAICDNLWGDATGVAPTGPGGFGPQNDDVGQPAEGVERMAIEHNTIFQPTETLRIDLDGRFLAARLNLLNNGAGADNQVRALEARPNRTPIGWEGPVYTPANPARPVVVP